MKNKYDIPKPNRIKYESFINKNGTLKSLYSPSVFCDTSFLLDFWHCDKHEDSLYKRIFDKDETIDPLKKELEKYIDPDKRTRKLFKLRKLISDFETRYYFIYTPACRFELEEKVSYINFKTFISENYNISSVERMSRKEIGNIVRMIRADLLKSNFDDNPLLNNLFFAFFQSTSYIHDGLPGFLEVDISNLKFTKKDFSLLYFFANQQMGFADLFHLISAKTLGCKYFFTFDSDFERNKDEIKSLFDVSIYSNIDEMIKLIK